jgi:DNA-binding CsgD family transcriptional regulator
VAPELVGREHELRSAERFLDAVPVGSRALLIQGPAGVGKTSVWLAAIDAARERGRRVLAARPVEAETSFGFSALGDLLRESTGDMRRLPERQARALEAALLLSGDDAEPVDRQAVALATLGVLRLLAERGPLVLAIDDAQWLDGASAAVVQFAARRLGELPVGLLVTARGTAAPLALETTFALARRLTTLALAPLDADATRRLLATRLRLVLPRPTMERLYALSGGHPFFALELGRAYRAGTARLEPGEPLPPTLDRLMRDRLAALSPRARRAVLAAAATAQPGMATLEGDVDALAEAARAAILEVHGDRIRFAHPLLASAAYASADPSERRSLHARLSRLVADPEERARHLALAATGPDERVAAALDAAARGARARGAPAAAASLYEWAARLTPGAAHRRRVDAAYCLFEAGDSRAARAALEQVADELPAGAERARALIRLARVRSYDDDLGAAESLFRRAIAEAGADGPLRAAAQEGVAATLFRRRERLDDAARHASAAARSAGDTGLRAEALGSLLLIQSILGKDAAAETLAATFALQDACEHRRVLAQPLFQAGCVWLWTDQIDRAGAAFERLRRRAAEIGDESSLPYVLVMLAQVECARGAPGAAAAHADAGRELTEQAGQATLGAYLDALRALADAIAGDVEHARARADRALAPRVAFVRAQGIAEPGAARFVPDHVEALIALAETAAAEELLRWYEQNARRLGRRSALAAAARCRALLRPGDAAVALLDEAVALSDATLPLERARTLLARGAAHRRARHKRLARDSLAAALALFEQVGARRWAERASAELARIGGRAPARGGLTATERRVAELIVDGLATKQVAAALFVSPKTVEGHLTNIYAKLGVHSRTQLARRLAQTRGEFPVSRVDAAP